MVQATPAPSTDRVPANQSAEQISKSQLWQERIANYERSALSIAEFCRSIECSVASFYQWRRKLRQSVSVHQRRGWVFEGGGVGLGVKWVNRCARSERRLERIGQRWRTWLGMRVRWREPIDRSAFKDAPVEARWNLIAVNARKSRSSRM